ncbi:MAG: type II secretion system F family protein [Actinomycetota bacterium]|nr:type II secretion system F family protein [Actinomycetota bacterium]
MNVLVLLLAVAGGIGTTLLLSQHRWFARRSLTDRLRPHAPAAAAAESRSGILSVESFRDVIGPLAATAGGAMARVVGIEEDLAARLRRVHSHLDPTAFRVRQLGWALASAAAMLLVGTTVASQSDGVSALLVVGLTLATPVLTFLVVEQNLARASAEWQRRIFDELPVVAEQLGMLLGAGYSLGGAISRIGRRGNGAIATDLARVTNRIRHGLGEVDALREWAALAQVPELDRLVGILALNRETGDLGSLIAEEARSIRREAQRRTITQIERRAQQVWIPVTVATLVPGVILMAVPFVAAAALWSTG